jgi:hypothetical protein
MRVADGVSALPQGTGQGRGAEGTEAAEPAAGATPGASNFLLHLLALLQGVTSSPAAAASPPADEQAPPDHGDEETLAIPGDGAAPVVAEAAGATAGVTATIVAPAAGGGESPATAAAGGEGAEGESGPPPAVGEKTGRATQAASRPAIPATGTTPPPAAGASAAPESQAGYHRQPPAATRSAIDGAASRTPGAPEAPPERAPRAALTKAGAAPDRAAAAPAPAGAGQGGSEGVQDAVRSTTPVVRAAERAPGGDEAARPAAAATAALAAAQTSEPGGAEASAAEAERDPAKAAAAAHGGRSGGAAAAPGEADREPPSAAGETVHLAAREQQAGAPEPSPRDGEQATGVTLREPLARSAVASRGETARAQAGEGGTLPSWIEHVGAAARLQDRRTTTLRFALEPRGLGRIEVRLSVGHDGVRAAVVAEHEHTRALIATQQGVLATALERNDLRLASFAVDLGLAADLERDGRGPSDDPAAFTDLARLLADEDDDVIERHSPVTGQLSVRA